ncbi:MAG: DUF1080 domain-containing protein [Planctomycetota bacterium]|nr:DUF1080 domain-containing protein [Planctomycetota bacterium]
MSKNFTLSLLVLAFAAIASGEEKNANAHSPFNGKDLTGWKLKGTAEQSKWVVGKAVMNAETPEKFDVTVIAPDAAAEAAERQLVNSGHAGVDIYTEQQYGDCKIELEFMIPKGSNSGVYVMGEYEIQILDSFGKDEVGPGDLGGLYGAAAPQTNASKAPGQWQSFVIDFQAPKFQGPKKLSNAKFLKITLNGQVIHENVEMKNVTPSGVSGLEAATGPLMFQGNHGEVAFRNIKVTTK